MKAEKSSHGLSCEAAVMKGHAASSAPAAGPICVQGTPMEGPSHYQSIGSIVSLPSPQKVNTTLPRRCHSGVQTKLSEAYQSCLLAGCNHPGYQVNPARIQFRIGGEHRKDKWVRFQCQDTSGATNDPGHRHCGIP